MFEKFILVSKQMYGPVTETIEKSELRRLCKLPKDKWIVEAWGREQSGMDAMRRNL